MRKFTLIFFLVSFVISLSAQEAKTLFANIPDSLAPLLSSVNRLDCIDFLDSNMKAKVTNKFGGESEMTVLTDTYIHIKMTSQSSWQMKVLPVDSLNSIICVVSTACAPVCNSTVRFYSTDWQELPVAPLLTLPVEDDFYKKPAQEEQLYEYDQLRKKADIFLVKAELSADDEKLSFTYTTPDYVGSEDRESYDLYIHSSLLFEWAGGKFVRL